MASGQSLRIPVSTSDNDFSNIHTRTHTSVSIESPSQENTVCHSYDNIGYSNTPLEIIIEDQPRTLTNDPTDAKRYADAQSNEPAHQNDANNNRGNDCCNESEACYFYCFCCVEIFCRCFLICLEGALLL